MEIIISMLKKAESERQTNDLLEKKDQEIAALRNSTENLHARINGSS